MSFHILVLAGGSGTRLWPLSRRSTPKHLLALAPGGETLLRSTLERVTGLGGSIRVVTAADQAPGCQSAPRRSRHRRRTRSSKSQRLAGPGRRWLSPWRLSHREDPDALIASVHADHRVSDRDAYRAAVVASAGWAAAHGRPGDGRARPDGAGDRVRVHRGRRPQGPAPLAPARWDPAGDRSAGGCAAGLRGCRLQGEALGVEVARGLRRRTVAISGISGSSPGRRAASASELVAADPELFCDDRSGGRCAPPRRSRSGHLPVRRRSRRRLSNHSSSNAPSGSRSSRPRSAGPT